MESMRKSVLLLPIFFFSAIAALCRAQESSSQATRSAQSVEAPRPTPTSTPTPEVHKRRSIPEVDDAMAKGQDLLFKKHDPRASVEEFKRAAKLDPWYGQAYLLLGDRK